MATSFLRSRGRMAAPLSGSTSPGELLNEQLGLQEEEKLAQEQAARDEQFAVPEVPQVMSPAVTDQEASNYMRSNLADPLTIQTNAALMGQDPLVARERAYTDMVGPDGMPQQMPVSPSAFQATAAIQEDSLLNAADVAESLINDDYTGAAEAMLRENNRVAGTTGARTLKRYSIAEGAIEYSADMLGTVMSRVSAQGRAALLSSQGPRVTDPVTGVMIPRGVQAIENLFPDDTGKNPDVQKVVADTAALAFHAALAQSPKSTEKFDPSAVPMDNDSDGSVAASDLLSSSVHMFKNGVRKLGDKVDNLAAEQLMGSLIQDAVNKGNLSFTHDSGGNLRFTPTNNNFVNRDLARASGLIMGKQLRPRAPTTPNIAGAGINQGELLTKKSYYGTDISTRVAKVVKDILGSIGNKVLPGHLNYKMREVQDVMETIQDTEEGLFSTHPLAHRLGISRKDFLSTKIGIEPPKVGANKGQMPSEATRIAKSKEIMQQKIEALMADLDALKADVADGKVRFNKWMHSTANQRFFPATYNLDYMSSKPMIRDVLNFGRRDSVKAANLFGASPQDTSAVTALQRRGIEIFSMRDGVAIDRALNSLAPQDLAAIGTMVSAVLNYYTVLDKSQPDILKMATRDLIGLYTPAIANSLATLGAEYNAYMNDPNYKDNPAHDNIVAMIAAIPKGEFLANAALWDDMYQLQNDARNPKTAQLSRAMSHTIISDGNQNGIFLQALIFGNTGNAERLGRYKRPKEERAQKDMRGSTFGSFQQHLIELNRDKPEVQSAIAAFFKSLSDSMGPATLAKEFFKKPLMQTAYSKDAGMFGQFLDDTLRSPNFIDATNEILVPVLGDLKTIRDTLNAGLEMSLREAVNSDYTRTMMNIGWTFAALNKPATYPGLSGDTVVLTPMGTKPIQKTGDDGSVLVQDPETGLLLRMPQYESSMDLQFEDTDNGTRIIELRRYQMQAVPGGSKGTQLYWDNSTQSYNEYTTYAGSSLARHMAVLTVQAMDGDLVKQTTLNVNNNRNEPLPIMWIHDSIISTPGASLIYLNSYNNIAIPRSMKKIAKLGFDLQKGLEQSVEQEMNLIEQKGPVGIYDQGEYSALGGFFDKIYFQYLDPNTSYKDVYLSKRKSNGQPRTELDWKKTVNDRTKVLKAAKELGYIYPSEAMFNVRKYATVTPKQFKQLFNLMRKENGVEASQLQSWAADTEKNSIEGSRHLLSQTRYGGIAQMTPGGGEAPRPSAAQSIADFRQSRIKTPVAKTPNATEVKRSTERLDELRDKLRNRFNKPVPPVGFNPDEPAPF
jgi:hypothetical protein